MSELRDEAAARGRWYGRRLRRSRRARLGALLLALMGLAAIFLEVLAAPAPIVAFGDGTPSLLPAISRPSDYRHLTPAEVAARHAGDTTVWPLWTYGPETVTEAGPAAPMSAAHPLGTDQQGRDVWVRALYGTRLAFGLAFVTLSVAVALGIAIGALAGYFGGLWDEVLSRPIELVQAVPTIVVVAVVRAASADTSLWIFAVAVASVKWAEVARLVRAEVVRLSEEDFVVAARALGAGDVRLLLHHILPHAVRPALVAVPFGLASVVLLEVAAAFIGLGVPGSWGSMLAEGLDPAAPAVVPLAGGLALGWMIVGSYLLAEAVSEAASARVATTATEF